MPDKTTIEKAKKDKAEGKSASTQAGEFVHAEMDKIRKGEHGARSAKQAVAIGLSEARRAGVGLKPQAKGETSEKTRKSEESAYKKGQRHEPVSPTRSRARVKALKKESTEAASPRAISKQAHTAAQQRSASSRSASAKQAARTKGPAERKAAARKAAKTRAQGGH
jgi:hypothetical protein